MAGKRILEVNYRNLWRSGEAKSGAEITVRALSKRKISECRALAIS